MNRKAFLLSITAIPLLMGCSRLPIESSHPSRAIMIDGKSDDWPLPLAHQDKDLRLDYSISNDDRNLFVCIRTADQATQLTMLQAGFFFSIDTSAKKEQPVSIGYPVRQQPQRTNQGDDRQSEGNNNNDGQYRHNKGNPGPRPKMDLRKVKEQLLDKQDRMLLSGFKGISDGSHPLNEGGIAVAMDIDRDGVLVYEAQIPFKTFFKDHLVPADTLKTWSFTMTFNGMEVMAGAGRRGGMGGGPRMGIGMGGPGMRIGGTIPLGGGGSGGGRAMIRPRSSWNYLRLK